MTTFYPKFYITLGSLGNSSVYIKDASGDWQEFVNFDYFKIVKRQNQVSEFELHIYDIQAAEKVYVKEFAEIMFFSEHNLILKGRVQKITYQTAYECNVTGFGMEAKLLEKELIKSGDKRVQYTNTSAQDIANEILSENTDGSTPWIITPNTTGIFDTDYGDISIRYEYGNRLNALAKLAEAIDYEWWISQGDDYDDDYFNLASLRPDGTKSTASQQSFTITGDSANCVQTTKEKDITNLANKADALGYGDGENQLHTSCYNASATYSTLSADITSTSTTISLVDASSFASSGTIRIMEEQVTYTGKSDNNLTNCTRGANSTTARAHKKNIFVEKHVTITNAESGSSIGDNGLSDYTAINKDILDLSTLELVASKVLLERKDPIARIRIIPNEPLETAGARDIGELITITDTESDIDSTYRIVGMTYESNYGDLSLEIEASNKTLTFIEQMQKQREQQENMARYMQGSTNIYAINEAENCDASTDLNLRFYLPSEAIAINKVLLSFKMKDFRSYTTSTPSGGGHTTTAGGGHTTPSGGSHTTPSGGSHTTPSGGSSTSGLAWTGANIDSDWGDNVACAAGTWTVVCITYTTGTGEGIYANFYLRGESGGAEDCSIRIANSGVAPITTFESYHDGFRDESQLKMSGIGAGTNGTSKTVTLEIYPHTGAITVDGYLSISKRNHTHTTPSHQHTVSDHTHSVRSHTHTVSNHQHAVSNHTHTMGYAINEETLTSPSVDVSVGTEGSESAIDTYNSDQENIDITSEVAAVGAGNWINIKFEPNKRMRIESNAYIQIFIQSVS